VVQVIYTSKYLSASAELPSHYLMQTSVQDWICKAVNREVSCH